MITAAAWSVPIAAMLLALLCLGANRFVPALWAMSAGFGTATPAVALLGGSAVSAAVTAVLAVAAGGLAVIERSAARRDRTGGAR